MLLLCCVNGTVAVGVRRVVKSEEQETCGLYCWSMMFFGAEPAELCSIVGTICEIVVVVVVVVVVEAEEKEDPVRPRLQRRGKLSADLGNGDKGASTLNSISSPPSSQRQHDPLLAVLKPPSTQCLK